MSTLSDQIDLMQAKLEAAAPYAHSGADAFSNPYRRVFTRDIDRAKSASALRRFSLTAREQRSLVGCGLSYRRFEAIIELSVLYPLGQASDLAERYFAHECTLVRELFERPDNWADKVRLVSHESSSIVDLDGQRLLYVHAFRLLGDQPGE